MLHMLMSIILFTSTQIFANLTEKHFLLFKMNNQKIALDRHQGVVPI